MDERDDRQWRQGIEAEAERLRRTVRAIEDRGLSMTQGDAYGETSLYDNHPADAGTETFEREKDLGLKLGAVARLERLGHALDRLERGEYGRCEVCGGVIDPERLRVLPEANLCIRCQTRADAEPEQRTRPIEEEVLSPPFGRTWRDDTGDVGYDGEDTWQDVGNYGTSETPQDVPGATDYNDMYTSAEDQGVVQAVEAMVDQDGEPIIREDEGADSNAAGAIRGGHSTVPRRPTLPGGSQS